MDDSIIRKLIKAVKNHPAIWNIKLYDSQNLRQRELAWESVVKMFVVDSASKKDREMMCEFCFILLSHVLCVFLNHFDFFYSKNVTKTLEKY